MSAQREHTRPDSVLITHISRANVIQACKPTHHRNHTWPSLYAFRLLLRCLSERRPLFWLLQLDGAVVSECTDTTWVSKTDGDCLVVWIYRFLITGSVARHKLSVNYACVCVGEDDKVLGGTVSELNPQKLRACWLTRSQQHIVVWIDFVLLKLPALCVLLFCVLAVTLNPNSSATGPQFVSHISSVLRCLKMFFSFDKTDRYQRLLNEYSVLSSRNVQNYAISNPATLEEKKSIEYHRHVFLQDFLRV